MKKLSAALLLLSAIPATAQQYGFSNKHARVVERDVSTDASGREWFNIHFQTTYIYQYKPSFASTYADTNSLTGAETNANSLTATLYLGVRLWKGAEIYLNPELAGGSGLSRAVGMGGSSNGETFRISTASPSLYLARGYFRQTFELRNKHARKMGVLNTQEVESGQNQLAGYEPKNYLRFYIGKLSLTDLFDNNRYSNSPRTQFLNWALMNNGAWDFAANARGYTYSFATELQLGKMNYKVAAAALPVTANGPDLNTDFGEAISANAEINRAITIKKRPGNIRLLGYYNKANMGNYQKAVLMTYGVVRPDINLVQQAGNSKYGFGLNYDQELSNTFGVFARVGWNDGQNQTWCFTEIDQTLSLGLSANGSKWRRPNDNIGLAFVVNGLSKEHQSYLANGGMGFMLGDGRLKYAPEFIGEFYYSFKPLNAGIWFSGDYQFCANPGYNSDRGPVHIFSARLHVAL